MPHKKRSSRAMKSHQAQAARQQRRNLWIALGLGGAGLLLAALFLVLRAGSTATRQNATAPEVVGAPRVAVDKDTIDYGDVKLGKTVNTTFDVRNVGDRPLQILGEPQVQIVEGC